MKRNNTWNIRHLVNNQFVPSSKRPSVLYCKLMDFRGARATQKIVDDSDYKRICLCSLLCSWNSSIISDSIHLISPSQQDLSSSFLDESSLLCLIFSSFFFVFFKAYFQTSKPIIRCSNKFLLFGFLSNILSTPFYPFESSSKYSAKSL